MSVAASNRTRLEVGAVHQDRHAVKVSTHLFRLKDVEGITGGAAVFTDANSIPSAATAASTPKFIEGGEGVWPQ